MNPKDLATALTTVPDWSIEGDEIARTYQHESFRDAAGFVAVVADLAEAHGHHPLITLDYRSVTLRLSTHSEGGLTKKDFELALACDEAARDA